MTTQSLHAIYLAMLEFERPLLGVQTSGRKALNNLSGFVVCYCKFNHVYRFLSSTFFENSCLAASLAVLGNGMQCLLTDQTVLDFPRADISFITEQQLWLTSENGAFVRACHSTRVPLS